MPIKMLENFLIEPLARYKKELHQYEVADFMERIKIVPKLKGTLNNILIEINDVIRDVIHTYYVSKLGKSPFRRVTVKEVIEYELQNLYHPSEIEMVEGEEELLFTITRESQKKKIYH